MGLSGWVGVGLCVDFSLSINTIISHIFIVVFLTEFTSPYSLNTQRGWHISE